MVKYVTTRDIQCFLMGYLIVTAAKWRILRCILKIEEQLQLWPVTKSARQFGHAGGKCKYFCVYRTWKKSISKGMSNDDYLKLT